MNIPDPPNNFTERQSIYWYQLCHYMIDKGVSYKDEKLSRIENLAWALGKYYQLKGKQDVKEFENLIRVELQSIPISKEDIEKYKLPDVLRKYVKN